MAENEFTKRLAGKPSDGAKFREWVFALTEPLRLARDRLASLPVNEFDIDRAEGKCLDAIGARVGIDRRLREAITGIYFAFDDVDGLGFDRGLWKQETQSSFDYVLMDDDTYRSAIKAKVILNHCNGTQDGIAQTLVEVASLFKTKADIQDNQDMTVQLRMDTDSTSPILKKLIDQGVFNFASAGVSLSVTSGDIFISLMTSNGKYLFTSGGKKLFISQKELH